MKLQGSLQKLIFPGLLFLSSLTLLGFLPKTPSSSILKKIEQPKDTSWLTYVEPNEFSIQYPSYWKFEGGGKNVGFEIVRLRKHDCNPCKNETCGRCSNSAYVSLHIQPKDSRSLGEMANQSTLYEEIWKYCLEKTHRDEWGVPKIIKLELIVDGYPTTSWFFDYKDDKYANLYGTYSNGKDSTVMANDIKRILESFKILE